MHYLVTESYNLNKTGELISRENMFLYYNKAYVLVYPKLILIIVIILYTYARIILDIRMIYLII